jgi:hypothetical protein
LRAARSSGRRACPAFLPGRTRRCRWRACERLGNKPASRCGYSARNKPAAPRGRRHDHVAQRRLHCRACGALSAALPDWGRWSTLPGRPAGLGFATKCCRSHTGLPGGKPHERVWGRARHAVHSVPAVLLSAGRPKRSCARAPESLRSKRNIGAGGE